MPFWFLAPIVGILVLYVVTSTVIIVSTRIKKTEFGGLVIDSSSWHFKMAYPFQGLESEFLKNIKKYGISICPYCVKFFWMAWLGWPLIMVFQTIKTVLYTSFMVLFGFYPVPMDLHFLGTDKPLGMVCRKIPLPKIGKIRILPVYLILPSVYAWLLVSFGLARRASLYIAGGLMVICIIIGIVLLIALLVDYTKNTDNESVSLLREWTGAKKKKICPIAKVI